MSSTTTTMMKIVSKKMIKPCTPSPQNLRNYKISFTDQIVPPMNIQIILFYSTLSPYSTDHVDLMNISRLLEHSLSNILPRFYPLAGRYTRKDHSVLCNDEGVEFVEAHACSDAFRNISEYVKSGAHEQLNDALLPRPSHEVDGFTDPMASIQVTRFGCGGVAIGLSVSHRIFDADSISTFTRAWAEEAKNYNPNSLKRVVSPSFDSPALLPFNNSFPVSELPARTVDPNVTARRFLFDKDTIAALKAKITDSRSRRVSKVGVVGALISEAVIRADQLKHEQRSGKNMAIAQVVNIRDRTIPPFPKHSCGNLVAGAIVKLCPATNDSQLDGKLGFEDLVPLLRDAIDETIADCASLFDDGGLNILYGSRMEMMQEIMSSGGEETKVFYLSDWSKFEYYEADFGWGKPIWTSIASMPVADNCAILMGNKDGDGIEAWVRMFKEDMVLFEPEIIKLYNNLAS